MEPAAGIAVKANTCPGVNVVEQVAPQSMPAGLLVTVPLPFPALLKVNDGEFTVNVKALLVPPEVVTVMAR
jgi:hypothetical protein